MKRLVFYKKIYGQQGSIRCNKHCKFCVIIENKKWHIDYHYTLRAWAGLLKESQPEVHRDDVTVTPCDGSCLESIPEDGWKRAEAQIESMTK